jgi:hypothetical protein
MNWVERFEQIEAELKKQETPATLESIPGIKLSEFERRDLAVEIYSEVIGCTLWLCSNEKMVRRIRKDAPDSVTYTTAELRSLLRLNTDAENMKKIHDIKSVFLGSTIAESIPNNMPDIARETQGRKLND